MSKVTEITSSFLRTARGELEAELQDFGEKHGLTISVVSARYMPGNATFKLQLATTCNDGSVNTKEAENFRLNAHLFGLKPEHLNAEITYLGKRYKLVGLASNSIKFPLIVERIPDGKGFRMPLWAAASLQEDPQG